MCDTHFELTLINVRLGYDLSKLMTLSSELQPMDVSRCTMVPINYSDCPFVLGFLGMGSFSKKKIQKEKQPTGIERTISH